MKIFANKSIWKKLAIIMLLVLSISFVQPQPVQAGWGGELMEPVCDLLVGLADGFMNLTHHIFIGQETTLIKVGLNTPLTQIFRVAVTAIVVILALAAAAILTAGTAIAIGAICGTLATQGITVVVASALMANIVPILVSGTYFGVKAYSMDAFDNELALPLYSISPERIFSNTIPLFDVNFFNPSATPFEYEWIHKTSFDDKYKPVNDTSNLDFSNAQEVTTDEMKQKIIDSKDVSITNKDLITKVLKETINGTTYIQYSYQQIGNTYNNVLYLGGDGNYYSIPANIDFSNAEDITTDDMKKELVALGVGTADNITNIKKVPFNGETYIRFSVRRNNIYL